MKYISVLQASEKWSLSTRSIRNYCASGRIIGAYLEGKTWRIPMDAEKPNRKKRNIKIPSDILERLRFEKENLISKGIYHKIQIDLTYNSNHIEGNSLTYDQTKHIFETSTLGQVNEITKVDDIVETVNHFRCVDLAIEQAKYNLSISFIKQLHYVLKSGTSDSRKPWFAVGDYKKLENEVGGTITSKPGDVSKDMKRLINDYNKTKTKTLEDIIDFHYNFEKIHPFSDGNGRVGRLIMFKECLRNEIVPFIITDDIKEFYNKGLKEYKNEPGYLLDTIRFAQDKFLEIYDEFGIEKNQ